MRFARIYTLFHLFDEYTITLNWYVYTCLMDCVLQNPPNPIYFNQCSLESCFLTSCNSPHDYLGATCLLGVISIRMTHFFPQTLSVRTQSAVVCVVFIWCTKKVR